MKSLKRSLDDKSEDPHSDKYGLLVKDADQLVDEFEKMFSLKEEMSKSNEKTISQLVNESNTLFSLSDSDSQPLTSEMKDTLMNYLRKLKTQASSVQDEHRKLYKTINKAIKDAEMNNMEDYDHLHSPFIASAAALNISEDERMAMLDPLIADHLIKRSYTGALGRFEEESRYGCEESIPIHFEEIKKLHDYLRGGDFDPIRRWLTKHEKYEKEESQNLHFPNGMSLCESSRDVTRRMGCLIDDFQHDDSMAATDLHIDVETSKHNVVTDMDEVSRGLEIHSSDVSQSNSFPQRYIGNQLLLSMGEKRTRLRFLLFKMEYIKTLHAACASAISAASISHNAPHSSDTGKDNNNTIQLVELARNLLNFREHFSDEVQHLIGAMVLAQEPKFYHKTVYCDLACPRSTLLQPSQQSFISDTNETWSSTMELQKSAGEHVYETDIDKLKSTECHYRHSPSYEDSLVEASALLSELVCLMYDQPPHDSLDLLVHLGLSIMPQVYEKKDVVTFLAQKSNADPQDYPIRVTNHEHAVHNVFHCPLKKDLFNAETDCVALTCGHVMSRAGFTGLKTHTRYARTLDGDRVICPYCPTHSAISRVRGVIF